MPELKGRFISYIEELSGLTPEQFAKFREARPGGTLEEKIAEAKGRLELFPSNKSLTKIYCSMFDLKEFIDPRIGELDGSPFLRWPLIWSNPKGAQDSCETFTTTAEDGSVGKHSFRKIVFSTQEDFDQAIERVRGLALKDMNGKVTGTFAVLALAVFDLRRPLGPLCDVSPYGTN